VLTIVGIAALTAALLGGPYYAPHAMRMIAVGRLRRTCARHRILVLTYDDGPGPELTRRVLALLADFGARATFFLLGRRVVEHPEVIDEVAAAGHEIGCHGYSHRHAWRSWPWEPAADVRRGYRTIERWVGANAPYRPPCGKLVLPMWWVLRRQRASLGWWTIDSGDTHATLPDPRAVVAAVRGAGGGVVLLHDFDRDRATRAARHAHVLNTTAGLLELARSEGLNVCTLGQLQPWQTPATLHPGPSLCDRPDTA